MTSYTDFEDLIFKYNGVIYGGYVRDTMISNYYETLFNANNGVETTTTLNRHIKPKDIDIFFRSKNEAVSFVEKLSDYGDVIKKAPSEIHYAGLFRMVDHTTVALFNKGFTFSFDLSYPFPDPDPEIYELEPPFNNLDMLCNGFLMDISGTRYSTCTGTYVDTLNEKDRKREIMEITYDIYKFHTHLTSYGMVKHMEPYIALRVIKMMKRVFPWTINNAPFKVIKKRINNVYCDCCGTGLSFNAILSKGKIFEMNCFLSTLEYHANRRDYNILGDTMHDVKFV